MKLTRLLAVAAATALLWLLVANDFGAATLASGAAVALAVALWSHLGSA